MFDEEKVKKDLERMREAYKKALKRLDKVEERQQKIGELIYKEKNN